MQEGGDPPSGLNEIYPIKPSSNSRKETRAVPQQTLEVIMLPILQDATFPFQSSSLHTFLGSDFSNWIRSNHGQLVASPDALGQALIDKHFFHPVDMTDKAFRFSLTSTYRLHTTIGSLLAANDRQKAIEATKRMFFENSLSMPLPPLPRPPKTAIGRQRLQEVKPLPPPPFQDDKSRSKSIILDVARIPLAQSLLMEIQVEFKAMVPQNEDQKKQFESLQDKLQILFTLLLPEEKPPSRKTSLNPPALRPSDEEIDEPDEPEEPEVGNGSDEPNIPDQFEEADDSPDELEDESLSNASTDIPMRSSMYVPELSADTKHPLMDAPTDIDEPIDASREDKWVQKWRPQERSLVSIQRAWRNQAKRLRSVTEKFVHKVAQEAAKRTQIAAEILETERTYVRSLSMLVADYLMPIRSHIDSLINSQDVFGIFSNVEAVLKCNQVLLKALEEEMQNREKCLGKIFLQMAPFFKIYTQYVNNYDHSVQTLNRCIRSAGFKSVVQKCQTSVRGRVEGMDVSLVSLLLLPIQRIPRYVLLLEDLKKNTLQDHPDQKDVTLALSAVREIASYINETHRRSQNLNRVIHVQNRLVGHLVFALV
eukprot:TRINITY_DN6092_c0_g1_i2.p1 TRINITY_DN6092_c0_g1~~TRINITY_DN6092_c0_g1_i2.p1  ORF type:complete len:594 (+),score=153.67 TRINITY_DN6092_c0_g1_i2:36-1817(+)